MKPCIIVDVDGTVADLTHRLHYVTNGNKNWKRFFRDVYMDSPIWPVIDTVKALNYTYGDMAQVVFVSGRSDVCRDDTEDWLCHYFPDLEFELYMRPEGDYRKDTVLKKEILERLKEDRYSPWLAIDDRADIASVFRAEGILTYLTSDWVENGRGSPHKGVLHVLVGPSGAGKSTFAQEHFFNDQVVSSDNIREEMTGDMADQSQNDAVFQAFHNIIRARIENGLDAVADATNLRKKDRQAVTNLAKGAKVVYHVINRDMESKEATGGWRLNVPGLLEKHEQRFKSQLKDILKGDGYSNVEVVDHRNNI